MAVTDLTNTTWMFNDSLTITGSATYTLTFLSRAVEDFGELGLRLSSNKMEYFENEPVGDYIIVYQNGSWTHDRYKVINISGGTDVTNATLIAWLETNAILLNEYSLNHSLKNITHGNTTFNVTPDTGMYLPNAISVSYGTLISYNRNTGAIVVSGEGVEIIIECSSTQPIYDLTLNFTATPSGNRGNDIYFKVDSAPTSVYNYDYALAFGVGEGSFIDNNGNVLVAFNSSQTQYSYTIQDIHYIYIWTDTQQVAELTTRFNGELVSVDYDNPIMIALLQDTSASITCEWDGADGGLRRKVEE